MIINENSTNIQLSHIFLFFCPFVLYLSTAKNLGVVFAQDLSLDNPVKSLV